MKKLSILLLFLLLLVIRVSAQQGRDIQITNPIQLQSALDAAQPGDTLWLHQGAYPGEWRLTRAGSSSAWITLRAAPGEHAEIVGGLSLSAPYWIVQGLDIHKEQLSPVVFDSGVVVYAAHIRLINNAIHDQCNRNGLGAWSTGGDQIFYGNIIYRNGCNPQLVADGSRLAHPHNIYTQNDFAQFGMKVFDSNFILEPGCSNNCYGLHAYSEGGSINGYLFNNNVFANNKILQGGLKPIDHLTYSKNVFINGTLQWGYSKPATEGTLENNTFVNSTFRPYLAQGTIQTAPYVMTNDLFVNSSLQLSGFSETVPLSSVVQASVAGNRFSGTLQGGTTSLALEPMSNPPALNIISNAYDPSLIYVAVWTATTFVHSGAFAVYDAHNLWGTPVVSGTNQVSLSPGMYVVRVSDAAPTLPTAPTGLVTQGNLNVVPATLTYRWNTVSGATGYYLYISSSSGQTMHSAFYDANVCGAGTCQVTPNVPLPTGNYQWSVSAYNAVGNGPYSNMVNFTVSGASTNVPNTGTPPASFTATPTVLRGATQTATRQNTPIASPTTTNEASIYVIPVVVTPNRSQLGFAGSVETSIPTNADQPVIEATTSLPASNLATRTVDFTATPTNTLASTELPLVISFPTLELRQPSSSVPTALPFPTLQLPSQQAPTLPTLVLSTSSGSIPTALPFPTLQLPLPTSTPIPSTPSLSWPFVATMDDGALDWIQTQNWLLGQHDGGLAWYMISTATETLQWQQAIDLRNIDSDVTLSFQSVFMGGGIASVQVSTDDIVWTPVAEVPTSDNWIPIRVDLSDFVGSIIHIEFMWQPRNGENENKWAIDTIIVDKLMPTTIGDDATTVGTATEAVLTESTAIISTPTSTLPEEATEEISISIEAPTQVLVVSTPVPSATATKAVNP